MSYFDRITELLIEGQSTGSNAFSTGERVGKFLINNPSTKNKTRAERIRSKVQKKSGKRQKKFGRSGNTRGDYHEFNKGLDRAYKS